MPLHRHSLTGCICTALCFKRLCWLPSALSSSQDFGLSFKMDNQETHMSSVWHGTLTHMAPEVLLQGCQSKASDV